MEISSIYSDLMVYRYASTSEVDSETANGYSIPFANIDNTRKRPENQEPTQKESKQYSDKLEISETAKKSQKESEGQSTNSKPDNKSNFPTETKKNALSESDKKTIEDLAKRDREVKAHEAAHVAAGGNLIRGGTSFEFQTGPDGKQYAIGGEVKIDTSSSPDKPDETIRKMQQIKSAALAPADPSAQDRAVAQMASSAESKARAELQKQIAQESQKFMEEDDVTEETSKPEISIPKPSEKSNVQQTSSNSIDEVKRENPTINNLIKSYKKADKEASETIGKIINKINLAPSIENLQGISLKIKPEYVNRKSNFVI